MKATKPWFITVEGVDGAGKSSHIPLLAELVRSYGFEVVVTREVGGTDLGEQLRRLLLTQDMGTRTEVLLAYAARLEHIQQVILPALRSGKWVISDRYADSTYAFQGGGRGVSMDDIDQMDAWCDCITPDKTILFDIDTPVALGRINTSRELDRIEKESFEFHQRVRLAYIDRVRDDPTRFDLIDASNSIGSVQESLRLIVHDWMRQQGVVSDAKKMQGGLGQRFWTGLKRHFA